MATSTFYILQSSFKRGHAIEDRTVVITGASWIAPEPLGLALSGALKSAPAPTPEITAFETAAGTPAFGFEALDFSIQKELPNVISFVDRTSAFALAAAKRALDHAGLLDAKTRPANAEIGCAYGSMLGCLEAMGVFWNKVKSGNPKFAAPLAFTQGYANSPASLLAIEFQLRGASAVFAGERLAGMEALLFAFDQIVSGSAEIMLAGASDSLTSAAHRHLFSSGQLCENGDWSGGMIPGEGAAMLVLESAASATARRRIALARLEGVNFFPLDPKSTVAPMRVATGTRETVVFSSTPNQHAFGGWIQHMHKPDMPAVAPKYFSGDMLSVSPLLSVALAARELSGENIVSLNGSPGLPLLNAAVAATAAKPRYAVATGFDPGGLLGVAMLS